MGRVYKALVRAERWSDRERAIGSPAPTDRANRAPKPATVPINSQPTPPAPRAAGNLSAQPKLASVELFESVSLPVSLAPAAPALRQVSSAHPSPAPPIGVFSEPNEIHKVSDLAIAPQLAALGAIDPLAAQRYRTLAAKLLSIADRRKLKTFLITSAEAYEGKTTVAINVAWLLAKGPERRVLLLDTSTNSSALAHALGISNKSSSIGRIDQLIRLDPNGLYILTDPAPSEAAWAELTSRFDIIVADSPSLLGSVETQNLAASLDGTIIVTRAGSTHRRKVNAARKLVPKAKRLGLVLNETDVDPEGSASRASKRSLFGKR